MVQHTCNKERELGEMAVKIDNLVTSVDGIKVDLKEFIKSADNKYATKAEVKALQQENVRQDQEITWTKQKIFDIVYKVGMIAGVIFLALKVAI